VKGTLTCVSGCTSISGNDSSFAVTIPSATTVVSIQLAGQYAAAPVCIVSAGTLISGTPVTAGITSVTWQPWGTTVTLKMSSAVPNVYGSCRGATG
jgi:hypothetical protein